MPAGVGIARNRRRATRCANDKGPQKTVDERCGLAERQHDQHIAQKGNHRERDTRALVPAKSFHAATVGVIDPLVNAASLPCSMTRPREVMVNRVDFTLGTLYRRRSGLGELRAVGAINCATCPKGSREKTAQPGPCSRSFGAWTRMIRIPATTYPISPRACPGVRMTGSSSASKPMTTNGGSKLRAAMADVSFNATASGQGGARGPVFSSSEQATANGSPLAM
jgi:hypothetical protein